MKQLLEKIKNCRYSIIKSKRLEYLRVCGAYVEKQRTELQKYEVEIKKIDLNMPKEEIVNSLKKAERAFEENRINGSYKYYIEIAKRVIEDFLGFKK